MNVIFLDIDGVVTSARTGWYNMDIFTVNFLLWLCKESNSKIVISSTWRKNHGIIFWSAIFGEFMHEDWCTPITKTNQNRGQEIKSWLENHQTITDYIILDDDTDMLEEQLSHFIQTNSSNGMLFEHFVKARDYFNIKTFPNEMRELSMHKNMFACNN